MPRPRLVFKFQTCPFCGEDRQESLTLDKARSRWANGCHGPLLCFNCLGLRQGRKSHPRCFKCGLTNVPIESHHVHGRASRETKLLCINCHREIHRGG